MQHRNELGKIWIAGCELSPDGPRGNTKPRVFIETEVCRSPAGVEYFRTVSGLVWKIIDIVDVTHRFENVRGTKLALAIDVDPQQDNANKMAEAYGIRFIEHLRTQLVLLKKTDPHLLHEYVVTEPVAPRDVSEVLALSSSVVGLYTADDSSSH